jgi:hypothetical protein
MKTTEGIDAIPQIIGAGRDDAIPLASPEAWYRAYQLMGREAQAALLRSCLLRTGADERAAETPLASP